MNAKTAAVLLAAVFMFANSASPTSFATGGCASGGCTEGDQWLHTNANELDAAIDELNALVQDFHASAYASGSSTAGIQEAVDAACAAFPTTPFGGKVIIPYGNVTTSATVTIDCERITLEGYGLGSRIIPPAGSAAILVTEDRVTLRDFVLDFAVSNAGNIGINLDSGAAGPSNVKIDGLVIDGASGSGIGVRCDGCLKSSIVNSNIRDWDQGTYWTGTAGTSYPNANSIIASTIASNTAEAVKINDLHSSFSIMSSTFESNGTGVNCDSIASGKSSLLSLSNHYENSSTAAIYRPDLGCAITSMSDRFADSNTKDYISVDTTNTQPSHFITTQFSTAGITNATGYAAKVSMPINLNGLSCGTNADSCTLVDGPTSECFTLYAPTDTIADTNDVQSIWRAPTASTIVEVWCETDTGTVTADLQIDDGTPADVMGTDLVCDSTGESDSTSLTGSMAAGDRLDIAITSVATSPTRLTFCMEHTR